jgi:ketosteroid isomerase-like protein
MERANKPDIIRGVFAAYKAKDRTAVEGLLTDDFTFTSPYDDAIDKATYFERCWPNSGLIRQYTLERIFVEGDEAFVTYRAVANDGRVFRNTEFFTFDGDRIAKVEVYFGASYKDDAFVRQE